MVRSFFLIGTTAFWLVMMSLLIQREFFQITPIQAAYEILPLHSPWLRQEYRALYLGQERVGFSFNTLEALEDEAKDHYELRHQTYLSFRFLGHEREMLVRGTAKLDRQLNLQNFEIRISSGETWTKLTGQLAGGNLNAVIEGKKSEPARRIIPVDGPVFFSEALNFIWTPENLKIGKQGRLRSWNPLMMNFQDVNFHVKSKETLTFEGKSQETFVIHLNLDGIETRAWVSPEGIVLREESPMGLISQKEPGWQIFDAMRQKRSKPPDLPNLFSIPATRTLEDPASLRSLKVKLKIRDREKVLKIKKDTLEGLAAPSLPFSVNEEEFKSYLESTPWVQASDPVIIKKAKEIVGEEKSALAAALKIMRWVHSNISPVPTLSLPQAREVLSSRQGDCNEYTVLFTALTRSLTIPSKMVAGLVYQNGRFFYHAWAEVYLGRWIGIDPTFGQAPVDVTHIPLVTGDLQEQVALIEKIGKIKVLILEAE